MSFNSVKITESIPAYFQVAIKSRKDAHAFLLQLHKDGNLFHLDDSPETIVDSNRNNIPLFTAAECVLLRQRVQEVFAFDTDPFEYCVDLINGENHE